MDEASALGAGSDVPIGLLTFAYDVAIDIWWALRRGKRVLTLGNGGGGVLAMCAAAAGASEAGAYTPPLLSPT